MVAASRLFCLWRFLRVLKRNRKKLWSAFFVLLVFGLTLWLVFRGEDLDEVLLYLQSADWRFVLPGIGCVIAFILGEALIIHYLMGVLGHKIRFSRCSLYSFIGFFYSSITPSASGGQPMQIVNMRKDRLPVAVSTVVLAIVTIAYKMVLVVLGLAVMVLRPAKLMAYLEPVEAIVYIGLALNIVCVTILVLLVFYPSVVRSVVLWVFARINRIRPFKNPDRQNARLERIISQYEGASAACKNHKRVMLWVFVVTFLQRIVLFAVTWFTYMAFGLSGHSPLLLIALQGMISVAADMMPLPGGMGISETMFLQIFPPIFGEDLLIPAMVISRGISYYTQLILSAVMTMVAAVIIKDPNETKTEGNL